MRLSFNKVMLLGEHEQQLLHAIFISITIVLLDPGEDVLTAADLYVSVEI